MAEEQWHSGTFVLRYTSLKMAVLLHKTALINFPMATTVNEQDLASMNTVPEWKNVFRLYNHRL